MSTLREIIQKRKAQKMAQQSPILAPYQPPRALLMRLASTLAEADTARDRLLALIAEIEAADLKGEKGDQPVAGVDYQLPKDGYTPIKGVDYFDGVDGRTPKTSELLALIQPLIPEPIPGIDGINPDIRDVLAVIKEEKLSIEDIRGLEEALHTISKPKQIGGGGMSLLAGSNITITRQSGGRYTIASTGTGSTLTQETPLGTVDGSNTTFIVTHPPVFVIIDGNFRVSGFGYTYLAGTISVDPLAPPVQDIRSFYNA
jgi:hypothetical protein